MPPSLQPQNDDDAAVFKHESKTEKVKYTCTASIVESSKTTWGVEFCPRPSQYHLKGPAYCWKRRVLEKKVALECAAEGRPAPKRKLSIHIKRDNLDAPIRIAPHLSFHNMFATANANVLRIYNAFHHKKPVLMQSYRDADPKEVFYCICWVYNADKGNKWWVCVAGEKGAIRVFDVKKNDMEKTLIGHSGAVHDMKLHPRDPSIIASASKDRSVRLWNLRSGGTVAIFSGFQGHHSDVFSVDFDVCGHRLLSAGMDNSVRIWDITDDDKVVDAIVDSHEAADLGIIDQYAYIDDEDVRKRLTPAVIRMPKFLSKNLHKEVVDCARWIGDAILSKSASNRMYLWIPSADILSLASPSKLKQDTRPFTIIADYKVNSSDKWFIRFGLDRGRQIVACGAWKGEVHVYRLDQVPAKKAMCVLQPKKSSRRNPKSYVRQCSFSEDGSILVSVSDGGIVSQYDRVKLRITTNPTPMDVDK